MYRIHRLGHIEAKSLELVLPEPRLRAAKQAYNYLSVGFAAEIERSLGLTVEGITTVRECKDLERNEIRILIT